MVSTFETRLAGYNSHVLSAFRIIFGLLYMMHGSQKLFGWPISLGPTAIPVGAWPFWWAGLIEFVLGVLITLGLFTRIAAFVAAGEMAFAYFYQHWPILKGDVSGSFWPIANGGELAVMFCFAFLLLATTGAGALSADARRRPAAVRTTGTTATGRRGFGRFRR